VQLLRVTALVSALLAISGCGGDGGRVSNAGELRCERTAGQNIVGRGAGRIANPVGRGPVYVSLGMAAPPPSPRGFASLRDDRVRRGRYYHKTLWAVAPSYRYPLEIRGHRTNGDQAPLEFQTGRERLRLSLAFHIPASSGWRVTPSTTAFPGGGCFAFEVKGHGLRQRILFEARE
jgi:hypothetical protein